MNTMTTKHIKTWIEEGYRIDNDDMDEVCNTYGRHEKLTQKYSEETWKEK